MSFASRPLHRDYKLDLHSTRSETGPDILNKIIIKKHKTYLFGSKFVIFVRHKEQFFEVHGERIATNDAKFCSMQPVPARLFCPLSMLKPYTLSLITNHISNFRLHWSSRPSFTGKVGSQHCNHRACSTRSLL